jgi:glycosyltransferase involved in cell wall biosynthesis
MPTHKIIIISNTVFNLVNFRKNLISTLVDQDFDVVAVAPLDDYISNLDNLKCKLEIIPRSSRKVHVLNDILLIFRYFRIFSRVKPDIVLSYTSKPNIYGSLVARVLGISIVNNISGLGTPFIQGGWLEYIVGSLYKVSLKKSKYVFFQNKDDQKIFIDNNFVSSKEVGVIPGSGIDLTYFLPDVSTSNIDKRNVVFLLIARMMRDKGIEEFVEAARKIKKSYKNVSFQLLGYIDIKSKVAISVNDIKSWENEGIIEYLGHTEDVRPFIAMADCVVLPSYREGTPRSLLEAASMGKPIIATNVAGCKEVVDDGINGYLCDAYNSDDLAHKMQHILALDSISIEKMGMASRKKMENEFDEKIVINKYLSVINGIIGHK